MFEINLVPEIKDKAIKAIKLRNLIFFGCMVLVAGCVAVLVVLGTIKGGQDIALGNKDEHLKKLSTTIMSFDDLDELLTIQSQLDGINALNNNKKVLSRIFSVMDTLLPTNGDVITISELSVNLDESTLAFDAQAKAYTEPFINYNVLNAFKQSLNLMRYDYGRYVDEDGNEIPTICIKEKVGENGTMTALWARGATGCDPKNNKEGVTANSKEAQAIFAEAEAEPETLEKVVEMEVVEMDDESDKDAVDLFEGISGNNSFKKTKKVARWTTIYRTPQFNEWYNKGYMTLDGSISGVQHFDTQCINYTGVDDGKSEKNEDGSKKMIAKWSSDNGCEMVADDMDITSSSDGRDGMGNLVLRFSAVIRMNPEVFAYRNKHMLTIAPTGKIDVTDSYIQVEGMFDERAADCFDAECKTSYEEDK